MLDALVPRLPLMRRAFLAALVQAAAASVCAQGIHLQSTNPVSGRLAVLEDDGIMGYLYLSAAGSAVPIRAVVVYSRQPPVAKIDWSRISKTGDAPPISRDIASATAVIAKPNASELSFRWSRKGDAVALLRRGEPLAFAAASRIDGQSKAVVRASPLAIPWNQRSYESIFEK
ncbi:MAG TPA: hypothetical protein VFF16_05580 [Telluria sp.]|nr:hypothetical protein [Telluria sp.]